MIRGSTDANVGGLEGTRPATRRFWIACAVLLAVVGLPKPTAAQRPNDGDGPFWKGPSDLSDWILSDDVVAGSEVIPFRGRDAGVIRLGPGSDGVVRRWLHGFVGRRSRVAAGPPYVVPPHAAPRPLLREEWRFRPFSAGFFMGAVSGGTLMDDWLDQRAGYFAGYRLGWDYTRYWGCEMRLAFGWIELVDSPRAIAEAGPVAASIGRRDSDRFLWDLSLLYYPWGDTTWRPFLLVGLGAVRLDFTDRVGVRVAETVFEAPLGVGVKYRYCDWLALRFDVTDNIAFGKAFNTVHDLAFTGGVEIRFGGTRKAYWPWNPGRHYW